MNEWMKYEGFFFATSCVLWFGRIYDLLSYDHYYVIYLWMNEWIYDQEVSLYALSLFIQHNTNGLCDSHGVLGETLFGPILEIEYVDAFGFLLVIWKW